MVAVGDQRRAVEAFAAAEANLRGDLVADEADHTGRGEDPEMCQVLGMDQPLDRLVERDHRADEDRRHNAEPGPSLAPCGAKEESDPERHRCQAVAVVVDQISEQCDAPRGDEDDGLHDRRDRQDSKADRDSLKAQTAALAVFPPIWFCNFGRTFAPIAALSTDLARGANTAAVRHARAAEHALACAPTAVRHAFATLASSSKPQPALLAATLKHYFPTVFGLHYNDLVNGFAAESVALAKAEAATAARNSGTAEGQIAAAARSAKAISKGLNHYQAGVVRVENANG